MSTPKKLVPRSRILPKLRAARVADSARKRFREWLPSDVRIDLLVSLEPFITSRPLCYYNPKVVQLCLAILENDAHATSKALRKHSLDLTHAILSLFRQGENARRETAIEILTPARIDEMERVWHPDYQLYIEHIYNHLLTVILEVLGRANGKDYASLSLGKRLEILESLKLAELAQGASSTVRNAIAHGRVKFGHSEVVYAATNDEVRLTPAALVRHLDRLADISASVVVALLLFLARNPVFADSRHVAGLPLGIRYLLVKGATEYCGFSVESASESEIEGRPILNLYCACKSRSKMVHRYDGLCAASQALYYGGQGYAQITVSIDCSASVPTFSPYKVPEMKAALAPTAPLELLGRTLDGKRERLWYDASALSRKFYTFRCSMHESRLNARLAMIEERRKSGLAAVSSRYELRLADGRGNRSSDRLGRIEGHAVINPAEDLDSQMIERVARHALRRLRRKLVRTIRFDGSQGFLRHPKYVWITVHSEDGRIRELESRSDSDSRVLAIAEWTARSYRQKPILLKNVQESRRGWRIRVLRAEAPGP